jgi:hypothetical protein
LPDPDCATHWPTRLLAIRPGSSHTAVSRIWRAFALAPDRKEGFEPSTDPHLEDRVRDIAGLQILQRRRCPERGPSRVLGVQHLDLALDEIPGLAGVPVLREAELGHAAAAQEVPGAPQPLVGRSAIAAIRGQLSCQLSPADRMHDGSSGPQDLAGAPLESIPEGRQLHALQRAIVAPQGVEGPQGAQQRRMLLRG